MKNDTFFEKIYKFIALISASIITLSGLIFLLSWHLGYIDILQAPPSIVTVSYASSLNIFLTGLAIFALFLPTRIPYANILGGIVLLITFSRIIELIFNVEIGVTKWMAPWIPLTQVSTDLMPAVITLGFVLIGGVLVSWTRYKRYQAQSILIVLASLTVFLLGGAAAFSYFVPIHYSFIWRGTPLNLSSQIIAMFIGIGLLAAAYYFDSKLKMRLTKLLPIIVTSILGLGAIFISWKLALEKTDLVEEIVQAKLNAVETRIKEKLKEDISLLENLSKNLEADNTHTLQAKSREITSYLQTQNEVEAVLWMDSTMITRFIFPPKYESFLNTPLFSSPKKSKKLKEMMAQKKTMMMLPSNKNNEFLIIRPTFWDKTLQGFSVFMINLTRLFDIKFVDTIQDSFALIIYLDNEKIFNINDKHLENVQHLETKTNFTIENFNFTVLLYPTQQMLDVVIDQTLTYTILFGGFVIAISAGVLTHFWQLAKLEIFEVEEFKKKILETEKEQAETLKSARIGTWVWDLKTNRIILDDFNHLLLGIKPGKFQGSYQDLLQRVVPEDRDSLDQYLKSCISKRTSINCTFRAILQNESIHWIVSKGKIFFDDKDEPEKMSGINWEVTSIKQAQLFLEISEAISKILSENLPVAETFDRIIQILYNSLNWSLMILWIVNSKMGLLTPSQISHIPSVTIPSFVKAITEEESSLSTIPNHVWTTYRPFWIKDISENTQFKLFRENQKEGMKGLFAFPILSGFQIIGVIELFKQNPFTEEVKEGFLNLMTSIGIEIGQYMQRRMAEEARAELADIITNAQNAIYSLSLDGIIKNWNNGAERIFGWKAEEVLGKPITITYPSQQIKEFEQIQKKVLSESFIEHYETQDLRKDGSIIWVDKTIVPIRDSQGNTPNIAFIVKDITKEKEIRDALHRNEKKFRDFVEATEEWFWEINTDLTFTYTNPIIRFILGYAPEEILNINLLSLLQDKDRKELEKQLHHCIHNKIGWSKRTSAWIHKDGSTRWLESNGHPIINEKNQVIGFRGVDRDVTERLLIEKSKNEFISVVSHELKTPLTSILGALGLIRADHTLAEKLKNLSEIAFRNSERLSAMVNDILDIEKIELGKLELQLQPISVQEAINESISSLKTLMDKSNIQILMNGLFDNVNVLADRKRLVQVLINLFSNAIKFSPLGQAIYVSMQLLDSRVRISIRDQGEGIPEEFKSRIFQRFAQADFSDSRSQSGTGLGLNICKNLVEKMNGTISFTSEKNKGSTFFFDLPRG